MVRMMTLKISEKISGLYTYFSNLLRILGIVSIGYYYGMDTMLIFHTFLGWVLFASIVLPVTYVYLKE